MENNVGANLVRNLKKVFNMLRVLKGFGMGISPIGLNPVRGMNMMQVRTKMKTHHSAAKRFIKIGNGYKRKQAGRKHGNGGFSSNLLRHLDSFVPVTNKGGHLKKLKKFLS